MRRSSSRGPAPAVALALLAVPIAGFLIARPDRPPERDRPARTTQSQAARRWHQQPSVQATRTPQSSGRSKLTDARSSARSFLSAYLAHVHGRGSVRAITHAAPELLRELTRHPVRVTPGQERIRPQIRSLNLAAQTGASVRAVAILRDSGGPPYPLLLYLERRASIWTVTRLGDV
jgi:hypothetical protein